MPAATSSAVPINGGEIDLINQPVQKSMDDLMN